MEVEMLVLKRHAGEEIIINERIRIRVLDTGHGSCRLAFEAPDSDRIRRAELLPFAEDLVQRTSIGMEVAG
jgi:carbon storage regulator CsrA